MDANLSHPLVQYVFTLKNCAGKQRKTDLANGVITNPDAILLFLHALGPFGLTEVRALSQAWKGTWALQTYFGPTQAYTGAGPTGSQRYRSHRTGEHASGGWKRDPLWWRCKEGKGRSRYANALTYAGMQRLAELIVQLPEHLRA